MSEESVKVKSFSEIMAEKRNLQAKRDHHDTNSGGSNQETINTASAVESQQQQGLQQQSKRVRVSGGGSDSSPQQQQQQQQQQKGQQQEENEAGRSRKFKCPDWVDGAQSSPGGSMASNSPAVSLHEPSAPHVVHAFEVDSPSEGRAPSVIHTLDTPTIVHSPIQVASPPHPSQTDDADGGKVKDATKLPEQAVDIYFPAQVGCQSLANYENLNRIEEGTYGVVYRARDLRSNEIYALKRLKLEREKNGFPITALREINTLVKAHHKNIVNVKEMVVGDNMDQIYIVMEFVSHDLKGLLDEVHRRGKTLRPSEVKTLMVQLLSGINHLHDNWILHRDLKTSNLLLSHDGILKIADFGLAREYGDPIKKYTPLVVTLWYRPPELPLGETTYSTAVDMWSVGCIFAELITCKPLFPAKVEMELLKLIFQLLGTPNEKVWPGFSKLPQVKNFKFTHFPRKLHKKFGYMTQLGRELLAGFLEYKPEDRLTAEEALRHIYFKESPLPVPTELFPMYPAKSEGRKPVHPVCSPAAPAPGGKAADSDDDADGFHLAKAAQEAGFNIRF